MKFRKLMAATGLAVALVAGAMSPGLAQDAPRMVVIQKISGIPWTDAMAKGVEAAGAEFGIDASLTGPATVDPAQQAKMLEDIIAQGVDILGFVPLDSNVAAPILERAQAAGIKVITLEGPDQAGKDWNVDLVDAKTFGEEQMKSLAAAMGEEGDYIVFVGTLTTPLHNVWADAAIAYQEANYPNMRLANDRYPGGDSVDEAQRTTLDAIKAFPNLKGVLAFGGNGPIGAGNAVRQAGAEAKVAVVGTCIPSQAQALIEAGIIREGFLWNPIDSGYAMVAVANSILKGEEIVDGMVIGSLGKAKVDPAAGTITFDKIMRFGLLPVSWTPR
jgi:simple sugar transport system substrate-binding protein